jgi:hypothetical protein
MFRLFFLEPFDVALDVLSKQRNVHIAPNHFRWLRADALFILVPWNSTTSSFKREVVLARNFWSSVALKV